LRTTDNTKYTRKLTLANADKGAGKLKVHVQYLKMAEGVKHVADFNANCTYIHVDCVDGKQNNKYNTTQHDIMMIIFLTSCMELALLGLS
jgi:hypothetical protein